MKKQSFSFSGSDTRRCFHACLELGMRGIGEPTEIEVNEIKTRANIQETLELLDHGSVRQMVYRWEHETTEAYWKEYLLLDKDGLVKVGKSRSQVDVRETWGWLRQLPFELAAGGCLEGKWWPDYVGPHFTGHYPFGWMCAFKGEGGHRWLVSRRFLDYGPWRLIRDEASDLSMVQFHDLEADEKTSFAQAVAGHQHLMDLVSGGVICEGAVAYHRQPDGRLRREELGYIYRELKPNFYDRASKTSIVLVQDREVSLLEMMEACAARLWQPYEGITVEQVAFVFFDPAQARRQLFDLWVRGLEVRAIEAGGEQRLDDSFEPPPPQVPEWVQRVRDREGF